MKKVPLLLLPFLFVWISLGMAQTNSDCLDCHNDPEFTMEKRGKEISLNVNPERFTQSAHGELECIDCHVGFDPDEEPHKAVITPVNCAECHDDVAGDFQHSAHAGKTGCSGCHSDVHIPVQKTALRNGCKNCHEKEYAATRSSVHAQNKNGAVCYDCHSAHKAEMASSAKCLACHGQKEFVHENIAHENLESVMNYQESIHGEVIECSDCHGGHKILATDSPDSPVNRDHVVNTCNECHDDVVAEYAKSEHYRNGSAASAFKPACTDCHGEHDIHQITDNRSHMSRQHEVEVCLNCHLDSPDVRNEMTHDAGFIAGYEQSIHGRAFNNGNSKAAICSDCHGAHSMMKASAPNSMVNKFNIAETCANCHEEIAEKFKNSIHGQALRKGVEDSPTCTDCHGEHQILEPALANSPVAPQNVSQEVCGPCHSSVRMAEKYGISANRFEAYNDSYHGLAVSLGGVKAANCASCHGVHNILPSSDPASKINKANLAETCGGCHPGANENFAKGKVHITGTEENDRLIYWISTIYIMMIVGTIGAMALHNGLDLFRKTKEAFRKRYAATSGELISGSERTYERMTLDARWQHFGLLSSFFILVITGFMLKFPNAWWVVWIREIGGGFLFEWRGLVHRIAAVVMVAVSVYHTYYLFFTRRGKQFLRDMLFRIQDLRDMIQQLRYNLGMSKQRPRYDRFNYIEKSEYWALVWGTIVMTLTGFALWFENQSMAWFSKIFLDVFETIHYYEAWLAFLAIVVWHLYYVIFNPDVYPMNFTWITGKVSEAEMHHEHPLELQRIKENEAKTATQDSEIDEKTEETFK